MAESGSGPGPDPGAPAGGRLGPAPDGGRVYRPRVVARHGLDLPLLLATPWWVRLADVARARRALRPGEAREVLAGARAHYAERSRVLAADRHRRLPDDDAATLHAQVRHERASAERVTATPPRGAVAALLVTGAALVACLVAAAATGERSWALPVAVLVVAAGLLCRPLLAWWRVRTALLALCAAHEREVDAWLADRLEPGSAVVLDLRDGARVRRS